MKLYRHQAVDMWETVLRYIITFMIVLGVAVSVGSLFA